VCSFEEISCPEQKFIFLGFRYFFLFRVSISRKGKAIRTSLFPKSVAHANEKRERERERERKRKHGDGEKR
jgi:hypothetical protein